MLYLRNPSWTENFLPSSSPSPSPSSSSSSSSSASSSSPSSSAPSPPIVADLARSLGDGRLYREVASALRAGIDDARAHFSFIRVRGFKRLSKLISSVAESDRFIHLFRQTQLQQELQVVPVLFKHSLAPARSPIATFTDPVSTEKPLQVISPPTDSEVVLALRVLEGSCLIDRQSRLLASQHSAVKEVIDLLSAGGVLEQIACLDALLALMVDMPANQMEFKRCDGLRKIADLVKNSHVDEKMRLKCAEFLILLSSYILPLGNQQTMQGGSPGSNDNDPHIELRRYLGNNCVTIIKEVKHMESSLKDNEDMETCLHAFAKQLLESSDISNW